MYHTNNSFLEEEVSSIGYNNILSFKISKNLNDFLPTENPKEKEPNIDDTFNEKLFSKNFKKIFDKYEKIESIEDSKYCKYIKFNPFNSIKNKFFPFNEGEGLKISLEKLGYQIKFITHDKISIYDQNIPSYKKKLRKKFDIFDFSEDKRGVLKKIKYNCKKRRFAPDDIRKKIKSKFHKAIKNIINLKLRHAGSMKFFVFFPQNFVTNVTVKLNKLALNYTYEDLIKTNLASDVLKLKASQIDLAKQNCNVEVLKYLDKNPAINKLSSFNIIRKMKYKDLLKAYFISKEFENSIIELSKKGEKVDYIEKYINEALRYVHFFSSNIILPKNKKNKSKNIIQIIYDEEEDDNEEENDDD